VVVRIGFWVCGSVCVSDKCVARHSMNPVRYCARWGKWNTSFWVSIPLQRIQDSGVGRHLSIGVQFGSRWQPSVGKAGRESVESTEFASRSRKGPLVTELKRCVRPAVSRLHVLDDALVPIKVRRVGTFIARQVFASVNESRKCCMLGVESAVWNRRTGRVVYLERLMLWRFAHQEARPFFAVIPAVVLSCICILGDSLLPPPSSPRTSPSFRCAAAIDGACLTSVLSDGV
jgi:hypothetical protein